MAMTTPTDTTTAIMATINKVKIILRLETEIKKRRNNNVIGTLSEQLGCSGERQPFQYEGY